MNELADIIEPVAPAAAVTGSYAPWIAAAIVAVVVPVMLAVWWRARTPRARARRHLRRLRREVARGIGARELAYRVAAELQVGLEVRRLQTERPPPHAAAHQPAWREFVTRLDTLRYQPAAQLDAAERDALVRDGARWLR